MLTNAIGFTYDLSLHFHLNGKEDSEEDRMRIYTGTHFERISVSNLCHDDEHGHAVE